MAEKLPVIGQGGYQHPAGVVGVQYSAGFKIVSGPFVHDYIFKYFRSCTGHIKDYAGKGVIRVVDKAEFVAQAQQVAGEQVLYCGSGCYVKDRNAPPCSIRVMKREQIQESVGGCVRQEYGIALARY